MCPVKRLPLFFVCLLLLSGLAWADPPATPQAVEPQSVSIGTLLKQAETSLVRLEKRLAERKAEVLSLQADLIRLSKELTIARELLEESRKDLTETRNLLDSLSQRYAELSEAFERYKVISEAAIRTSRRKLWLWRGLAALGAAGTIWGLSR